ncbi:heparin lyase I family protein [Streptomyces lycii]|uniref:Polysaccharide lyase-like protein n=1 Tax=Streptomyces lycii TaxID=2654337 RepID=A0ABQ7FL84_9ACTN|nr:heparin lyase I family protein [Streptomyces lycii]KAF4409383.1 hypothetical protein GCU69_09235 [Streptomyces lycii]
MRKRSPATAAAVAAMMLGLTPGDAHASVIWDGDASHGTGVFADVLCASPSSLTVTDWNDGRGDIFAFNKQPGSNRCEGHGVRVGGFEYRFTADEPNAYWFGWESMTKTGNAQTVFQWKSNGTNDQNEQNYPVIMKVEDSRLKVWYVAPGEQWTAIGSVPWAPEAWHKIELGIYARPGTAGRVQVFLDGAKVADRSGIQTWDTLGNKPRWGTYGSAFTEVESTNWINGLRFGTTGSDVQRRADQGSPVREAASGRSPSIRTSPEMSPAPPLLAFSRSFNAARGTAEGLSRPGADGSGVGGTARTTWMGEAPPGS